MELPPIAYRVARRFRPAPPAASSPDAGPVGHEPNPARPQTLSDVPLFAVVKTWMDEDVIEATVRNALVQGADAVFVVDNASTDATVARAEAAGATVAEVYDTPAFDGRLAQVLMNATVIRESLRSGADHVWWMFLDSDEFPEGPGGQAVKDHLAGLDRRFRVVGATCMNHLPDAEPAYVPGFHPIDFQPLCYRYVPPWAPPCGQPHWKHPLQRFDRRGHFLASNNGFHWVLGSDGPHLEPTVGIVTHHFQYRDEATTRAKLDRICGPGSERLALFGAEAAHSFRRRMRSLDAAYAGRWEEVDDGPSRSAEARRHPRPWPGRGAVRRWYDLAEAEAARARWRDRHAGTATATATATAGAGDGTHR